MVPSAITLEVSGAVIYVFISANSYIHTQSEVDDLDIRYSAILTFTRRNKFL